MRRRRAPGRRAPRTVWRTRGCRPGPRGVWAVAPAVSTPHCLRGMRQDLPCTSAGNPAPRVRSSRAYPLCARSDSHPGYLAASQRQVAIPADLRSGSPTRTGFPDTWRYWTRTASHGKKSARRTLARSSMRTNSRWWPYLTVRTGQSMAPDLSQWTFVDSLDIRHETTDQQVRERRASSSPFSLSCGPLMPVRSFSAIRQAK